MAFLSFGRELSALRSTRVLIVIRYQNLMTNFRLKSILFLFEKLTNNK